MWFQVKNIFVEMSEWCFVVTQIVSAAYTGAHKGSNSQINGSRPQRIMGKFKGTMAS